MSRQKEDEICIPATSEKRSRDLAIVVIVIH